MMYLSPGRFFLTSRLRTRRILRRNKVHSYLDFPVIEINRTGDHEHKTVSIEDILKKSTKKLALRDLRILSNGGREDVCSILPRPHSDCIVIEILALRLLVWEDKCLMLEHPEQLLQHHRDCQASHAHHQRVQNQFLRKAKHSIANERNTNEFNNVLRLYQNSSEGIEFEQKILESALAVTIEKFGRHLAMLSPAVDLLLQQIAEDPSSNMLRRLLAVKKSLGDFESNVLNLSKILQSLLSNDEDMVGLYLTHRRTKTSEHEEVELLLESYLADLDDIQSSIKRIKERIEDTNHFIAAHLDTARNKMIRMSLFMEMGTLSIGSGALIAGIFGMNLTHGLEEHPTAFYATMGGISAIMFTMFTKFRANYQSLRFDTTNAHSFKVLKNFLTYVDELEDIVHSRNGEPISEGEFKSALNQLVGHKVPAEEAEFIFQMFDKNKDRKIDTINELKM
eukprot:TRINITY_DN25935_c0_g1_i1.p1 TRINITY_DN25935_c0_g1~~TRINITY_DN25935_c0_g1_i1.p1  ORF type:complete len:451 (+),score=50.32 TRINITY_DN25935_c0_g1_i1:123-1475(+)